MSMHNVDNINLYVTQAQVPLTTTVGRLIPEWYSKVFLDVNNTILQTNK